MVNNAVNMTYKLLPTDIILDNAADTSIIHPMLLEGVHEAERSVKIMCVGGKQMVVNKQGHLNDILRKRRDER